MKKHGYVDGFSELYGQLLFVKLKFDLDGTQRHELPGLNGTMKKLPTLCVCVAKSYHSFITTVFFHFSGVSTFNRAFFRKKTYKTLYCLQDAQCTSTHCAVFGMQSFSVSERSQGFGQQKQCTQALSLISLNTLNVFLHNFLITPFSHHALLDTHKPPLLICTPPFSHHHGVPKYTLFTHMTLLLAQK